MDDGLRTFSKRHRSVQRKHRRLAQGYVTKLGTNGIIVHKPRRDFSGLLTAPALIAVFSFFAFKVMLLANLGPEAYEAHLEALATGNGVEKAGAILMSIDPVTERLTELVALFI